MNDRNIKSSLVTLFKTCVYSLLPIKKSLGFWFSQEPADLLIRQTAREQWSLIATTILTSLVEAATEGATLGVIFFAVQVLSSPSSSYLEWTNGPLFVFLTPLTSWLSGLSSTSLFIFLLSLAVVLQTVQSLARFLGQVSSGYFAARCRALVTSRIHSQILSLSFPCSSSYKVGDLTDYAVTGPEAIRVQIEQTTSIFVGVLLCITYLGVLVRISPWLLLSCIVLGGLIFAIQKLLLPKIRSVSREVTISQVAVTSRITENFQGLRVLHSTGQLDHADHSVRSSMGELERHLRRQARFMAIISPLTGWLLIVSIAIIASLSLFFFGDSASKILPGLVTFVLALQKFNGRLGIIASNLNQLSENSGRFGRLNDILSSSHKQFRRLNGIPFTSLCQGICFDSVDLQYSPSLPPALESISFYLKRGQTLALVGPSGAGKSSIADLLSGLYAPTHGEVLIDGVSLDHLNLTSWQQRLGVVSQDTFLFNATISQNIAFGTPGATQADVEKACIVAQAAGFIESLPHKYDTRVGERGYRLSGGQRQRLSLARAILRNPELLILDEATSALDSQSERLVQKAIDHFERDHTLLVIAHRLSTIVGADHILVLNRGQIIQSGTHSTLLERNGLYRDLWQQQVVHQ